MFKLSFLFVLASALNVSGFVTPAREINGSAPYHRPERSNLLEDRYIVAFHDGHSLEDHFEAIGLDLSKISPMFYRLDALNAYQAQLDGYTVHELVRLDPGVKFVDHDSYMAEFDHGETHEDLTPEEMNLNPTPAKGAIRRWTKQKIMFVFWWDAVISAGKKITNIISWPSTVSIPIPYSHLDL